VTGVAALTADVPLADAGSGPGPRGASTARTMSPDRCGGGPEARSAAVTSPRTAVRSWPLLVLAVPAAAEVWSGWVGIARLTGFGMVAPLPGIWPSLHLDTSVTLPVGVEAYAAYALRAWLAGEDAVSPRTRRFAKWSALVSLALGMAGRVTCHLLAGAGTTRAPWAITTIVSCLPVLVLAMGTALAHLLHHDATNARTACGCGTGQSGCWSVPPSSEDQAWSGPGQAAPANIDSERSRPLCHYLLGTLPGEAARAASKGIGAWRGTRRQLQPGWQGLPTRLVILAGCVAFPLALIAPPASRAFELREVLIRAGDHKEAGVGASGFPRSCAKADRGCPAGQVATWSTSQRCSWANGLRRPVRVSANAGEASVRGGLVVPRRGGSRSAAGRGGGDTAGTGRGVSRWRSRGLR
jgi:hypothetical protein